MAMNKLCAVVFLGASLLLAADDPKELTFELGNGRCWNSMPSEHRNTFLQGMLDGWSLRGATEESMKGSVMLAFSAGGDFTTNDLADMIASVYADAENLGLPVGCVALGCVAVKRGDTTRDTVLMALRKHMGDLLNSKGTRPGTDLNPINVILRAPRN